MRVATLEEKCWMAGFVDGEGYIGITLHHVEEGLYKGRHSPVVKVVNTYLPVFVLFVEIYAGIPYFFPDVKTEKPKQAWECPAGHLASILEDVGPYLRIKHEQAKLLSEYLAIPKPKNGQRKPMDAEIWESRHSLYLKLKALNRKGRSD